MTAVDLLLDLADQGVLQPIDVEFARTMLDLTGETRPEVGLALALASRAPQNGHVCLGLADVPGTIRVEGRDSSWTSRLPPSEDWCRLLTASPLVSPPDVADTPLVLDGDRLYLRRFWDYQQALAEDLTRRAAVLLNVDVVALRSAIERVWSSAKGAPDPGQLLAVAVASLRRLTVITGGPGTGKTTTVTRLMGVLQLLAGSAPLRIALAAPTGKAAARMAEAIRLRREGLPADLRDLLPSEATTIHRLLGYQRRTPAVFRHGRQNPLPYDVIIVDEASMIPLSLMTKLVAAIPPEARLIFLGDRDQLASVEAGAVLNDLCPPSDDAAHGISTRLASVLADLRVALPPGTVSPVLDTGIRDSIVSLTTSHRFGAASGIGALARAVNTQDVDGMLAILQESRDDLRWIDAPDLNSALGAVRELVLAEDWTAIADGQPEQALASLDRFSLLCGHRQGPLGVTGLNQAVQRWLRDAGILRTDDEWFVGRPVMVAANDNEQRLYNGDIGIVMPAGEGARRVYFPGAQGQACRAIAPTRLPEHDTAFALTIHKSQGSEFDRVVIVLPERESPILTKELLYTAITRARQHVTIIGSAAVLRATAQARVQRASGLQGMLWG
jgi:exodeoxyribonuclease V alpha subunit